MRVLGIETSSSRGSIALLSDDEVVAVGEHERANAHAEAIQQLLLDAMKQAGWKPKDLDVVAVGQGPGSFTGLRVGIALAQGIATGRGVPLVGVPSLAAMAAAIPPEVEGVRVPLVDARRGEYFLGAYSAQGDELLPARAAAPEEIVGVVESLGASIVTCGEQPIEDARWPRHFSHYSERPHAVQTARLGAIARAESKPGGAQREVLPLYVRDADARLPHLPESPLDSPRTS